MTGVQTCALPIFREELATFEAAISLLDKVQEGKNESARKALLTLHCQEDADYVAKLEQVRAGEYHVGKIRAELTKLQARERGRLWMLRIIAGLSHTSPDDA